METQPVSNDSNDAYVAKINPQCSPPPPFILNRSMNSSDSSWGCHENWRVFLSLTGGTIFYCLSAMSIVYGMWQIIGPVLAKSNILAQILPCILTMNLYELALLAVLLLLVVWRHDTDDAISLLILIAIFMVVSGLTLTTATPSGPEKCLVIGALCAAVGIGKLFILRKWISIHIGIVSFIGLSIILAWNFIIPSLLSKPFATGNWPEELRREQWMLSWLALLGGAILVLIEALRSGHCTTESSGNPAFVQSPAMMRIFSLVLLTAACLHQHAIRFMFLVDGAFGDYLPWLAVFVLLFLEMMRSYGRRFVRLEAAIACLPPAILLLTIWGKAIRVSFAEPSQWLFYPPVLLSLTGFAVLWMGLVQRRQWFGYVALVYALSVLLTVGYSPDRPHDLNWRLCGGALVAILLILGILKRNPGYCFAAVIVMAAGLGTFEKFVELADGYGLTIGGAVMAATGLGTMMIYLIFGKRTHKAIAVFGAICLVLSTLDFIPAKSAPAVPDLPVAAVILILCVGLWLRTRDTITIGILCLPLLPRLIMLTKTISSWGWIFVVLSFVLLFLGAAVSFYYKKSPSEQDVGVLELKG